MAREIRQVEGSGRREAEKQAPEDRDLVPDLTDGERQVPVVLPVGGEDFRVASLRERRERHRVDRLADSGRAGEQSSNPGDHCRHQNRGTERSREQPPKRHEDEERQQKRPEGVEAEDVEAPEQPPVQRPDEEEPSDPPVEELRGGPAAGADAIEKQPEADAEEKRKEAHELVLDEQPLDQADDPVEGGGRERRRLLFGHVLEPGEDEKVRAEDTEQGEPAQAVDDRQPPVDGRPVCRRAHASSSPSDVIGSNL